MAHGPRKVATPQDDAELSGRVAAGSHIPELQDSHRTSVSYGHSGARDDQDDEKQPAPCRGLTQRIYERISRPDDTDQLSAAKYVTAQAAPAFCLLGTVGFLITLGSITALSTGIALALTSQAVLLVYSVASKDMSMQLFELALIGSVLGVICMDWANAAVPGNARIWQFVVLAMDMQLVAGTSNRAQMLTMGATCIWLVTDSVELAYRLGMYDIEGWSRPPEEMFRERTECARPPCATGLGNGALVASIYLFSLIVDFVATRRFSTGQRIERDRVLASIDIASQVAASLVRFDLDEAAAALDQAGGTLPGALQRSFRDLLSNLASYRPYLPQSCLVEGDEDPQEGNEESSCGETPVGSPANERPTRPWSGSSRHQRPSSGSAMSGSTAPSTSTGRFSPPPDDIPLSPLGRSAGRARKSIAGVGRRAHQVLPKRASLLVCNRRGFLGGYGAARPVGQVTIPQLQGFISSEVESFVAATQSLKGVVDLLSADHMFASFSAALHVSSHRVDATRCGAVLTGLAAAEAPRQKVAAQPASPRHALRQSLRVRDARLSCIPLESAEPAVGMRTVAVCSGLAVCGDFGSASAQRFMVIGGLSSALGMMDRLAARWEVPLLTDGLVQDDIQDFWFTRLRKLVVYPKRGNPAPLKLWEVVGERQVGSDDEWMYALEAAAANPWDQYNAVVHKWAAGKVDEALGEVDANGSELGAMDSAPAIALSALQKAIRNELPPVSTASDAGADAGDPYPLV
eukprot:TRINITY_DN3810_c1_g1_i1.p1 TRINITY_DN3810_c1_g1~~TRINITY_DN3810_c1_g1_i1.p1  ORF type:complete len:776 (+),score=162.12 TRINITY_DN3810_c1_g1_i1:92-2329(+)